MRITQEEINEISEIVADLTMATTDINLVDKGGKVQSILLEIEKQRQVKNG